MVITQSHIYQPLFYLQLDPNEIVRDGSQNRKQRGQYSCPPRHSQLYKIFRAEVWSALSSWLPFRSAIAFQIIDFALIIHIGSPGGLVGGGNRRSKVKERLPSHISFDLDNSAVGANGQSQSVRFGFTTNYTFKGFVPHTTERLGENSSRKW